jgi:hypothetical protein
MCYRNIHEYQKVVLLDFKQLNETAVLTDYSLIFSSFLLITLFVMLHLGPVQVSCMLWILAYMSVKAMLSLKFSKSAK